MLETFLRALPEVVLFLALGRAMWHIKGLNRDQLSMRQQLAHLQALLVATRLGDAPPEACIQTSWGMFGKRCGDCSEWCTVVRPGKCQCDNPQCPQNLGIMEGHPWSGGTSWGDDSC